MKNKVIVGLPRWTVMPLLLGIALSWSASAAVISGSAAPEQKIALAQAQTPASNLNSQEMDDRIKKLEDRERQNFVLALEWQHKKIDWWLNFLAVILAVLALFSVVIPYILVRKDKEIIEQDKTQIKQWRDELSKMQKDAEQHIGKIRQYEADAAQSNEKLREFVSGTTSTAQDNESIKQTIATVQKVTVPENVALGLRAEAIAASQAKDAAKAYKLWSALIELAQNDANAHFNAGYWAQKLGDAQQGAEKLRWLRLARAYYAEGLKLTPDHYMAASNWGLVLADEAGAIAASEPDDARVLWQQAREKYQLALNLKPDFHTAAYNWGNALADEAGAIAASEPDAARALWQQAREKYQLVLKLKPDDHEAASNWGTALAKEAKAIAATEPIAARALWQQAGEKYQLALKLKPDHDGAANNWGTALAGEAKAIAVTEPDAARALWQQAGEKYQLALKLKPDSYEAASNWGAALLGEAGAIAVTDAKRLKHLLNQAEQLLLGYVDAAPKTVAYNLACVYGLRGEVQACLKWLQVSQDHKGLPDCAHLRDEKDLNLVRHSPAFVAWFKQVCP